jgi:hypothetical protein
VDGSPDASFGNNGIAVWTVAAYGTADVALEPDGRIVLAGTMLNAAHESIFAAARFLATGPAIGSFAASPNPAPAGSSVTLTGSVVDLNPGSTVTQVSIYLDANGDGTLESGTDTFLGYANLSGTNPMSFSFTTSGLAPGTYTFFTMAEDNYGVFGDPVAVSVQVN